MAPQTRALQAKRLGAKAGTHANPFARGAARRGARVVRAAGPQFKGCDEPIAKRVKVVGVGSCGVDYLASVAAFPSPDEKLRTEKLEVQGGGNCANALTAAARLGLSPTLVTKIGGDGLGDGILAELAADGIDTAHVLRATGHPSPFTYIIVDRTGGTRTCIHTPGANLTPDELNPARIDDILTDAALVYFDGRLTEAAVKVAQRAKALDIPVLVEGERLRPGLDALLSLADYVVTSAHFPQDWTGEKELSDALISTALRLPSAKWIITTLGSRGCIMLSRQPLAGAAPAAVAAAAAAASPATTLETLMAELAKQVAASHAAAATAAAPVCVSRNAQTPIRQGVTAHSAGPLRLAYTPGRSGAAAAQAATAAARAEASKNADPANAAKYAAAGSGAAVATAPGTASGEDHLLVADVVMASAAVLPGGKESVVDTTGAGDSFIGSVLYGLSTGLPMEQTLRLAAVVAACKCTMLGARPGLPARSQISRDLLVPPPLPSAQ